MHKNISLHILQVSATLAVKETSLVNSDKLLVVNYSYVNNYFLLSIPLLLHK